LRQPGQSEAAAINLIDEMTKKTTKSAESHTDEFVIQPSKSTPNLDASQWPLLLKVRRLFAISNIIAELRPAQRSHGPLYANS